MEWIFIGLCIFIVWWVYESWDNKVTDEFVEGMKRAEREHGKKDEDEKE